MSQENVELARRAYAAFSRRDRDAWLALHHPDFEFVPIPDWPERGGRGREAAWDFYVNLFEAFDRDPVEPRDVGFVDAVNDTVVVHQRLDVSGVASGIHVDGEYWIVATIRQGRFVRARFCADRAEALDAAGHRE